MVVWFNVFVGIFLSTLVVFYSIYIWNYLPNYKKMRVYISSEDVMTIENQLCSRELSCEYKYSIDNVKANVYKVCFLNSAKESCYRINLLKEGKYTVVLVQYDAASTGKPIDYTQLDQFVMRKMDVKLK